MTKLIEVLTGVEIYQIPDMFGHAIVKVHLEKIEDLLLEDYSLQAKNENELNFNTRGFADAISSGFIPAIECFFVHRDFVTEKSLEYENLRAERMSFVTTKYANRVMEEFDHLFKESETILIDPYRPNQEDWKTKIRMKLYCIYQLDSFIQITKNNDLPGKPLDFSKLFDVDIINNYITKLKEEALEISNKLPEHLDYKFIVKTLRIEYFSKIKKFYE
jgi:hypothetical protein